MASFVKGTTTKAFICHFDFFSSFFFGVNKASTITFMFKLLKRETASLTAQTPVVTAVSGIYPNAFLPFNMAIEQSSFRLPFGLHSAITASWKGVGLLIGGRWNGLHGFGHDPLNPNFALATQNTAIIALDFESKRISTRSLADSSLGLLLAQIEALTVTAAQFYQHHQYLYIVGGYGYCTEEKKCTTKPYLTVIDVEALFSWVTTNSDQGWIRAQIANKEFCVTGGELIRVDDGPFLLIMGQEYDGNYGEKNGKQKYTMEIRRFHFDPLTQSLEILPPIQDPSDTIYRRRDFNVGPFVQDKLHIGAIQYAGVFTKDMGVWTEPVVLSSLGIPLPPTTPFYQAMNHYACAHVTLYSRRKRRTYIVLFGGISFGFFDSSTKLFTTDSEVPFINQCLCIQTAHDGTCSQYLIDAEFPSALFPSLQNNLSLFGTNAAFFLASDAPRLSTADDIVDLDRFIQQKRQLVGYIVGGIQSRLPNTHGRGDTQASDIVFPVRIFPR